jgi:hypothetical protein
MLADMDHCCCTASRRNVVGGGYKLKALATEMDEEKAPAVVLR